MVSKLCLMEPKGGQMEPKRAQKVPKWSLSGAKMEPKWRPKRSLFGAKSLHGPVQTFRAKFGPKTGPIHVHDPVNSSAPVRNPGGSAASSAPGARTSRAKASTFVPASHANAHNPILHPTRAAPTRNAFVRTAASAPGGSSSRAGPSTFVRAAQVNAHNPILHPIIVTSELSLGESIAGPPSVSPDAR